MLNRLKAPRLFWMWGLCSFVLVAGAQAQSAQEIAARVEGHYNHLHSLRVFFTESYHGMGMNREESGTLMLEKPGKMRWEYSQPAGKLFVMDGQYAYSYAPGDGQIQRIPAKALDDMRSPLRLLLGRTRLTKELVGLTATPAGNGLWRLSGSPAAGEKRVESVALLADATGAIASLEIHQSDGAVTSFEFKSEQPNARIEEKAFHMQAPVGIPIVDAKSPL
jgi:outer membrane lipoprotein carrier protein